MPKDIVNIINDFNDVFEISDKKSLQGKVLRDGYKQWMENRFAPNFRETEYQMKDSIYGLREPNSLILQIPVKNKSEFRTRLEFFRDPIQWFDFLDTLQESDFVLKNVNR